VEYVGVFAYLEVCWALDSVDWDLAGKEACLASSETSIGIVNP
jgi:hypothetical protein